MIETVNAFMQRHGLQAMERPLIVGVSGGPDSMVLLDILEQLGYDCRAVHVNYGLRGASSDADEALVRAFCGQRGIDVSIVDGTDRMRSGKESLQACARRIRYEAMATHAGMTGASHAAVAHHADDQIETVLIAMARKAGLDGLAGMRPVRTLSQENDTKLIRPLLGVRRADILRYASRAGVPYREDASNRDARYLRSRIRHDVLPALIQAAGEGIQSDILELNASMQGLVDEALLRLVPAELHPGQLRDGRLPLEPFLALPEPVRAWLYLRHMRHELPGAPVRRSSVESMEALLDAQAGRRLSVRGGAVWRERQALRFVKAQTGPAGRTLTAATSLPIRMPDPGGRVVRTGAFGRLVLESAESSADWKRASRDEIFVDRDRLGETLFVRSWEPGDRFKPLGMEGTKKIKSFLTDENVPAAHRDGILVLCDRSRIVWVIGMRMDDRYRIRNDTRNILRVSCERPQPVNE